MRHLKWRDQDEGRAVPMPTTIAAKVREHLTLYGTFRVEKGLNRLEGDYLFSNVGRTNILMYSLVDRLWRAAKKAADITRKITPHWLRHFFASAGLSKGVPSPTWPNGSATATPRSPTRHTPTSPHHARRSPLLVQLGHALGKGYQGGF
ncbi:tyrosine-type recombinase/integrase [Streptomyces cinnamoneus]|uniref:tyrosine-type recombinase/integrase n=1 Tax=Streptomyces cinnamoneus TaxID=53446 RepID=UPI0033E95421